MIYKEMTTKETYFLIRSLEIDAGENLFDCNEGDCIFKPSNLMFYLYGKNLFSYKAINFFVTRNSEVKEMLFEVDKYSPFISIQYPLTEFLETYIIASFIKNIFPYMMRLNKTFISQDCKFEINENFVEQFEQEINNIQDIIDCYDL